MSNASPRWHNLFPDLDFDPDALRERYRQERDKRLRDDGENQYLEAAENFAHYADEDPYTAQTPREAIKRDVNVVVVGGGFSGLMAAARLKERGVEDVLLIEAGGDFGGT